MSNQYARIYKLETPKNNSSLSTVPTLSSTPKNIWFKICKNRNRNDYQYINVRDNLTYDQLKQEIYKQLKLTILSEEFSLSVFDFENHIWTAIDESNLSDNNGFLKLTNNSILNIEKREHMKTNFNQQERPMDGNKLFLMLCRQPKYTWDKISLEIQSSATLGQLKEKARKFVKDQETHNLYLEVKGEWIMLGNTLNSISLAELNFITNSTISFGTKYDPIPGVCGLANLGNTCFMNSALQCLSNVPMLTRQILSFDEKMNAPVIGAYINLIKTIWSGEYTDTKPSSLLINICEDLPRFTKYRQHDVQEFMNHFLHLLHQELTNESTLITRLFHGQIQSNIQCLNCNSTVSNIETISFLPLPMDNDINRYDIIYLEKNGEQRLVPIRSDARSIGTLIESFIKQYRPELLQAQIKPVKIFENNVTEEYDSHTYIDDRIKSCLVLIEVLEKTVDQKHLKLDFIDRDTQIPFRPPLYLVGPSRKCQYSDILEQVNQVRDHICSITNAPTSSFHLYRVNSNSEYLDLSAGRNMNELLYNSDQLLIVMDPKYVDVYKNRYNFIYKPRGASLKALLKDFFREELLNGDYYCSTCQTLRKAKQKADFILPLPPVLIIQLKRFSYDHRSSTKIDTFIDFPLKDLDLNEYITPSDIKNGKRLAFYDLVAVSNHTGTLNFGHYTTYAKNSRNKKWYSFNDSVTHEISDELDVVTKNAYILVYVRQTVSHKSVPMQTDV